MSRRPFRKSSRKPYKSRPQLCGPALDVIVVDGWTYVNAKTADHYVRLRRPTVGYVTIRTREPR